MKTNLFVDMDGVLAEFRKAASYSDLFKRGYFASLRPQKRLVKAVKDLCRQTNVEVFILSSYLEECNALQEKNEWLDKYLGEIDSEHRIFLPCGKSKADAVPGFNPETDILLDDYGINCTDWQNKGGRYIKVSRSFRDALKEKKRHRDVIWPNASKAKLKSIVLRREV